MMTLFRLFQYFLEYPIKPLRSGCIKAANKLLLTMNLLKRLMTMTMVGGAMICLTSCNKEDDGLDNTTLSDFESVAVDTEASMDVAFEDVDNVVEAGINFDAASGGKVLRDPMIECAVITKDEANDTVIIDYGEGCEGEGGRTRRGKILVTYSDVRWFVPGATRSVTFEDFYLDSVKVEGVRTITNISADEASEPKFKTELEGGKLIWNDGTFVTRNSVHTRSWMRAANPVDDETVVEGSSEGLNREGEAYASTISEPLVFKRRCGAQGYYFPVSGVIESTNPGMIIVIDYGDGECDNLADVTINGETKTIELDVRARREVIRKRMRG